MINSSGYFVFTASAIDCKAVVKNEVWNRTNACRSGVRRVLLNLLATGEIECEGAGLIPAESTGDRNVVLRALGLWSCHLRQQGLHSRLGTGDGSLCRVRALHRALDAEELDVSQPDEAEHVQKIVSLEIERCIDALRENPPAAVTR
jgi:hypothetical protein